ncbi:MAG: glycosyltransferase family 39 protein [Candidatus Eremiobacteraeota bacterium]|nr:glycosyltransferase family 39 protein [Candidatus Eremiobacteraeota bacterium]
MRTRWLWSVVAAVALLRAIAAARLPLTGDEAYYWEWSRHLALGYTDHPPLVAYAIASFAWLGRTPFAVRIPFVLCGLVAAVCAGAAASRIARDQRAGAITAVAVALTPMLFIAFGIATPDGPYLLFWALTLYLAVRAFEDRSPQWFALLGIALGGAFLSRLFGIVLLAGVLAFSAAPERRWAWRGGMWFTAALFALCVAPFFLWNADHGWSSFVFALLQRHAPHVQLTRPLLLHATLALAYSPGLYIAAALLAFRRNEPLIAWTVLPLSIVLTVLAFREPVEVYWFFGPFISLCVAMGVSFVRLAPSSKRRWAIAATLPASLLSTILFIAVLAPGSVYAGVRHFVRLSDNGPFEAFSYPLLAANTHKLVHGADEIVMTDGYGFSSLLDFYARITPVVIGYDAQGSEARRWYSEATRPRRALFLDKIPLQNRPDFQAQLSRACRSLHPGPTQYFIIGHIDAYGIEVPPRQYYSTWCEGVRPGGISILRWGAKTTGTRRKYRRHRSALCMSVVAKLPGG